MLMNPVQDDGCMYVSISRVVSEVGGHGFRHSR